MKLQIIAGMRIVSFGHGHKTMVVLPGLSLCPLTDDPAALEAAFASFTGEFTVYLFDVKDVVEANYSLSQMADELAAAMQSLGLSRVALLGCSLGGMAAISLAGKYPALVEKLVVAASSCRANETSDGVLRRWIALAEAGESHALTADMGRTIYSPAVYEAAADALSAMAEAATEALRTRFARTAAIMVGADIRVQATAIRCPVLVVGSLGDAVMTAEASQEIAALTGAELILYGAEYPHAVYDEAPDFRERVKAFFLSGIISEGETIHENQ